jgi:hypothetical protein
VRIVLRADSGFCHEELMGWCEQNQSTICSAWRGTNGWEGSSVRRCTRLRCRIIPRLSP